MAGRTTRHDPDEESPLLTDDSRTRVAGNTITPLPKLQVFVLLLLQLSEPICSQSIDPFINQLVTDFDINGGDQRQTGYYAGLIVSLFFVAKALTVYQWGRLSDSIGRKPVLLTGVFGAGVSMLSFGLSRTFPALVVSRCLAGLLNGNIGIIKSIIGEITDATNRAQGFAMIPLTTAAGSTLGPLLGGFLSHPQERFPQYFPGAFWTKYPYFLPCAASAACICAGFLTGLIFLKETVPEVKGVSTADSTTDIISNDKPVPFRALLVHPVIVSVINYTTLGFIDATLLCLIPLFLSTSIEFGGLGLSPFKIGRWLSSMGFCIGIFQALCINPIMNRYGPKQIFIIGLMGTIPAFALFPLANILARENKVVLAVVTLLCCQLICRALIVSAYVSAFIFITTSSPNSRSLGATHGLAQTAVCISRAAGRMAAASAFAFSAEHNLLGGYAVYGVCIILSVASLFTAACLPEFGWVQVKRRSR